MKIHYEVHEEKSSFKMPAFDADFSKLLVFSLTSLRPVSNNVRPPNA